MAPKTPKATSCLRSEVALVGVDRALPRGVSPVDLLHGRDGRAELHRGVLDFLAACAESDSSDDSGEDDCGFHD